MKIGLITTLDTNIGDDLIREGICRVLGEVFKGKPLSFISVNKHKPYTVYPAWHPIHLRNAADRLPAGRRILKQSIERLFPKLGLSRFDDCDLIVQCGAPVFWPHCSHNEWAQPLWHEVVGRLCGKIPVLNLAAGSCYPWERQPTAITIPEDEQYLRAILGYCRLTTVRDRLSQDLCRTMGTETPLIPCSAFLAAQDKKVQILDSHYILINYMTGGGHYSWEQGINDAKWEETIKLLIARLGRRHKMAFLCHNDAELSLARQTAPDIPVFFPRSLTEYFDSIAGAKFAICNRMHASVGMAGLGVPSLAVGTDTRLLMVSQLGLKTFFVKAAPAEILEESTESALRLLTREQERLFFLKNDTWKHYVAAFEQTLSLK